MPLASAAFLTMSLVLAVLFGTQTSPWMWGPAMISLLLATITSLIVLIRQPSRMLNPAMLVLGTLTVFWFGIRAMQSPVKEFAQADLMLMAATLGAFVSALAIFQSRRACWVLTGGIATLLLANLIVMIIQKATPGYRPLLANPMDSTAVTGFFTHYNYAANYLLVSGLWLVGAAWNARNHALKIGLGLLGALGLAAIWWTGSRGGLLAAIIGLAALGGVLLIEAKRNKARWFPAVAIAAPFVVLVLLALLFSGWRDIQSRRSYDGSSEISGLLDNKVRLNHLDLAVSSIANHPLAGGGSQSFGWECFQHLNPESHGGYYTKPEFVHNEWLQAATDYGLTGFGLLFTLIAAIGISAVLRLCFEPRSASSQMPHTHMRLAGLAGLAGILVHANFSFIFHLMPGALLLGLCLAASCQWQNPEPSSKRMQHLQRGALGLVTLPLLFLTIPLAWKSARVMATLWPSHYSKHSDQHAAKKIKALDRAIEIWPQAALLMKRGLLNHRLALTSTDEPSQRTLVEKALADYTAAQKWHPYLPDAAINRAKLLSQLQRDEEAEIAYTQAVKLQGGMEAAFRGHYEHAIHQFKAGSVDWNQQNFSAALAHFEKAATHIEQTRLWNGEAINMAINIHESLGLCYEINELPEQALKSYHRAATLHPHLGLRAHFRTALLQAAMASRQLEQREPAKALALFQQALESTNKARGRLPHNITPKQSKEFIGKLNESIKRLRDIGIEAD